MRSTRTPSFLLLAGLVPSVAAAAPTPEAPSARAQANAAYAKKEFAACGQLFARSAEASTAAGEAANDLYGAACCFALGGRTDQAFQLLTRAVGAGFRDLDHAKVDTDLVPLRADPRWKIFVEGLEARRAAYLRTVNAELFQLYREDQADRQGDLSKLDWNVVSARDGQRRARVEAILGKGGAKVSDDFFHAAMVFQHGLSPAEFLRSHELALEAIKRDPKNDRARWLAAASKDRYLMNTGKPQLYGTQFRKENGKWILHPVDPKVTDEERRKWNVPSLAEATARAEAMNAHP